MNLRKKFSGQYMLICMFAFFIRDYKEQITTLKYELDDTEKQLKSVKNSKAYKNDAELEDLARNQLGMVKQNEIIYLEK